MERHAIGTQGEAAARDFLERKGYRHLASNWRCKVGEIDLVMQDGATRVFVEVRTRRPTTFGEGIDTVARDKQHKFTRAVQYYQQKERYWGDVRFDVVSLVMNDGKVRAIEHIAHAFTL